MGLVNHTYLQQYSGVLRWLDENGNSVNVTTLSDTTTDRYCWDANGNYFYTSSPYSTGRIEKWARDGSAYTWRRTGIDNVAAIAVNSNGDCIVGKQDDVYLLGVSDGLTDYSDIGSSLQYYTIAAIVIDSSDNIYVFAADYFYYSYGLRCFQFDSTLNYSSYWQVNAGAYGVNAAVIDSSGNFFVVVGNGVLYKFNSSGTQQWSYHPHPSGAGYGNVNDVKLANGKVYGCHSGNGSYIFRLTDNGGSYTEDWNVNHGASYSTEKITVSPTQVVCHSGSGSFDTFACDETDGSEDTSFIPYDVTGATVAAFTDPLAAITAGFFEVTHEIQYSRWVKSAGYEIVGHFDMPLDITVRGYGSELIDKIYTKGNYSYIGTPTPRYYNFAMVGDPMAEDFGVQAEPTQTYTYNAVIDDEYNQYVRCYRYYTAQEAFDRSDGYLDYASNFWSVKKFSPEGVELWETGIIVATVLNAIAIDLDFEYVYLLGTWTAATIWKASCETGEWYEDTYWPIPWTDTFDEMEPSIFKIGRDNKLYGVLYDYSESSAPFLYKWNLDGTPATNWSSPYEIVQHPNGTSPNFIDVTPDGTIAMGCVKLGEGGDAIKVLLADKTLDWEGALPSGDNAYGCDYLLIHDTEKYIIAETYSGIRKITGETSGICDVSWIVTANNSTGEGYLFNPFWSYDQEYFYANNGSISSEYHLRKYRYSDGNVMWKAHGDDDTQLSFSAVASIPVPAWEITVTFGSNGIVKTYWGGNDDGGVPLTSGDVVLAEAGRDFTFEFVGDAGYYVDEVTVDGNNLGYKSSYTFENVLNKHTIYVTFGDGFPSGPFVETYSLTGGILATINAGHLSESYDLTIGKLQWFVQVGALSETYAITGQGYLPWEISLLYLINSYRSSNAVASVTVHEWLEDGAQYAVDDMVANGTLTLSLVQIMGQDGANYPYLYAGAIPAILDESFTPNDLFDAWIADGPTEAIILNSNYEEVGIVVENYDGDNYVFVLFAQWHPQYTVERFTENFDITHSLGTDVPFFNFMSAEAYSKFLQDSASIHLPRYAAKIGDYEIPNVTSFTYRLELGTPSSLTIHALFDNDVFEQIQDLQDEELSVESIVAYQGTEVRNVVVSVDFTIYSKVGGENPKLSVGGYSTLNYYESTVALRNVMVRTKDEQGKTRFRCSQPDFYIRPGCTVTWNTYSIVVEKVVIFVTDGLTQYMDLTGE